MQINIEYSSLYEVVERSLSVIGKRSTDDQGNLLFKDITLGSRETALIYDYFRAAIVHIAAELEKYVSLEQVNDTHFLMDISLYDDANEHLDTTIREALDNYIVSYALYSWFTVVAPRIYEKYLADANTAMQYLIRQCHHRQRPDTLPNPLRNRDNQ